MERDDIKFEATTPVNIELLQKELAFYPDKQFVDYLINGFKFGFDTGISMLPNESYVCKNLRSALNEPEVVSNLIDSEIQKGYLLGPFNQSPFTVYRISPIGLATGKYSGKKRLIIDLSAPRDNSDHISINSLIDKDEFSLKYVKIDDAIKILLKLGVGSWLCKTDISDAFKQVPINPSLWHIHGIQWENKLYFYTRLTFGCRSSPRIFDNLSRAICWIAHRKYKVDHILHLLDDFLTIDSPTAIPERNMAVLVHLFASLSIPTAPKKTIGPTNVIEYLGITLDSIKMEARLPEDKLRRIVEFIDKCIGKSFLTKRELLSLLGHLNFACRVIIPGRSFVSYLIELSKQGNNLYDKVKLNKECRQELEMWFKFLSQWNGIALFLDDSITPAPDFDLYTDASSTLGYGGYFDGKWFQGEWPQQLTKLNNSAISMALLELYPIVIAAMLWGHQWARKRICFHCDNQATVYILNKKRSKSPVIMMLMRRLAWCAATNNFFIYSAHLPGKTNEICDAISRFQMDRFRRLAPQAAPLPCQVPEFSDLILF